MEEEVDKEEATKGRKGGNEEDTSKYVPFVVLGL